MSSAALRLFIALTPPDSLRSAGALLQAQLPAGLPLRLVDPQRIHLTLQFLGDTAPERVAGLLAALASLPSEPIDLHLGPIGAFPHTRRPEVLWLGLGGDLPALHQLQRRIVAATAALGFAAERPAFRPHLTIARVRANATATEVRSIAAALASLTPPPPVPWQAESPALFQSTLTAQGAIYRRIEDTGYRR